MTPVEARVVHRSPGRVRVRIPARRGDANFFESVRAWLSGLEGIRSVEVNPATASVLVIHDGENGPLLGRVAGTGLVRIVQAPAGPATLAEAVAGGYRRADHGVRGLFDGYIDAPSLAFVLLAGMGAVELARGNVAAPAWYTAFWYALNILLKAPVQAAPGGG